MFSCFKKIFIVEKFDKQKNTKKKKIMPNLTTQR